MTCPAVYSRLKKKRVTDNQPHRKFADDGKAQREEAVVRVIRRGRGKVYNNSGG
jgi:hypothetical protein